MVGDLLTLRLRHDPHDEGPRQQAADRSLVAAALLPVLRRFARAGTAEFPWPDVQSNLARFSRSPIQVSWATGRAGSIGVETLRVSVAMLFRGSCLAYARCGEARFLCLSWRGLIGLEGRSSQPCGRGPDVASRIAFLG